MRVSQAIASLQQLPFRAGGRGIIAVWHYCAGWLFGTRSCGDLLSPITAVCQWLLGVFLYIGIVEDQGGDSGGTAVHDETKRRFWSHLVLQPALIPCTTYDSVRWCVVPKSLKVALFSLYFGLVSRCALQAALERQRVVYPPPPSVARPRQLRPTDPTRVLWCCFSLFIGSRVWWVVGPRMVVCFGGVARTMEKPWKNLDAGLAAPCALHLAPVR